MPLVPIAKLMSAAQVGGYAVGYFESWNIESLLGVIDAAEMAESPLIIGFNGEFMSNPERIAPERLEWLGALGRTAAEHSSIPCSFIFNECPSDDWVRRAVTAGFNLVMPVPAEGESDSAYVHRTRNIVAFAHDHGVAVEAELGTLPFGTTSGGEVTDPQQAAAFIAETGVDLLAISAGNVHVLQQGRRTLDLERITALCAVSKVPLVLHGGTGIDDDSLRQAIQLGVAKVNYGTVLKQAYLRAVRTALDTHEANPHELLGMGGIPDVMVASRHAVRDAVLDKMQILGCIGRARHGR
ncbi:MAG: class II fructose-bisphosphate aldolase [Anaerolineae bacterium]|nr:class II fructose-bisphosphate aldolase [Anaerolineae bacterium]